MNKPYRDITLKLVQIFLIITTHKVKSQFLIYNMKLQTPEQGDLKAYFKEMNLEIVNLCNRDSKKYQI